MKILGIGNAIVDVLCKVSDDFLIKNSLVKSTMKLVDEAEFKKLLSSLKIEETISGGSIANSIVGLSKLGNKVGFIGKVSDDELGEKYEEGLKQEDVQYFYCTDYHQDKTRPKSNFVTFCLKGIRLRYDFSEISEFDFRSVC